MFNGILCACRPPHMDSKGIIEKGTVYGSAQNHEEPEVDADGFVKPKPPSIETKLLPQFPPSNDQKINFEEQKPIAAESLAVSMAKVLLSSNFLNDLGFLCRICESVKIPNLKSWKSLLQHCAESHLKTCFYRCGLCGYQSPKMDDVRNHQRSVHREQLQNFKISLAYLSDDMIRSLSECFGCPKSEKVHYPPAKRQFLCDDAKARGNAIKREPEQDTDSAGGAEESILSQPPVKKQKTETAFKPKSNWITSYLGNDGNIDSNDQKIDNSREEIMRTRIGKQGVLRCLICQEDILIQDKQAGIDHALFHMDLKPFSCRLCGEEFDKKSHVQNHVWRLHDACASGQVLESACIDARVKNELEIVQTMRESFLIDF